MLSSQKSVVKETLTTAFGQVDCSSLVFFRIAFGWLMAGWAWNYLTTGRVSKLYIQPEYNFTFAGFDWVSPWPGNGMYFHFLALLVLALAISVGFLYRLSSLAFAALFTYVFLLERTNYQNHYYLIALMSWALPLLPLNRYVSVDAWWKNPNWQSTEADTLPVWVLWIVRFHIGIPYFFGGIAKLTPDWLVGQPMGLFLSTKASFPVVGPYLATQEAAIFMSLAGLLFDLFIVPALLWKRTRTLAYVAAVAFHLMNSVLFDIHIFPWFMIAATPIFFDPSWPRRILSGRAIPFAPVATVEWTLQQRLLTGVVLLYLLFHCAWPLRHRLYEGDASWHERGHLFSWRMMLRAKEVGIGYAVIDPLNNAVANLNHKQFLVDEQAEKFARDPQLIVQFAKFIAAKFEKETGRRPAVHAFVLASLNGRKPQFMIDPNINLAEVELTLFGKWDWLLPLTEELRNPPWTVPVDQWRQHVEMPRIEFLERMKTTTPPATPANPN